MMKKKAFTLLLLMAFMAAGVQTAVAQNSDSRDYNRGWYAGLSGGTSFGQATFRSITESKTHWGALLARRRRAAPESHGADGAALLFLKSQGDRPPVR